MRSCGLWLIGLIGAAACPAVTIEQYHSHDFAFSAGVNQNPFDVDVKGEFEGPGGIRLTIPGFYDGNGTWKIRFSPTVPGHWSLRTISDTPGLNGHTEAEIQCEPNRSPAIHGGLLVDPLHPHHFIYQDGTRYFLMGYECDWLWALGMDDPQRKEMRRLIRQMADNGFNHVLANIYAYDTTWSPGRKHQWDLGPAPLYPWEGSNENPDHSRLNPAYFQRYDEMVEALRDQGIVAHLMIKVYNKLVNWPKAGSRDEERYFRYVTARYQADCNVVWDFSKESYYEKDKALQSRLIDLIRANDAYHRLTTAHDNDVYDWDAARNSNIDFRTDQQHTDWAQMIAFDRDLRPWPVLNAEFGYEKAPDGLPSYRVQQDWPEVLRRAYLIYLAGGYGAYYYHNTAWDVIKIDPEPPGYKRFRQLKETLSNLPYWEMVPSNDLAVGGSCLSLPGRVYAFYAEAQRLVVNLRGAEGAVAGEWIDTWTGAREKAPVGAPGVYTLDKPKSFGSAPGLLILRTGR
jgi:hypothetical protein